MIGRLERDQVLKEFTGQVNSWGSIQTLPEKHDHQKLLGTLPPPVMTLDFAKRLDRFELGDIESEYLWQSKVFRDIGRWVVAKPYRDPVFAPWLEKQKVALKSDDALKLEHALKLFDWTIRNVSMEGNAADVEKLVVDPSSPNNDNQIGYRTLPWLTALFGHGDVIQRARVFTQLLFQQNIPSFMIAVPSDKPGEKTTRRLWAIGVPIGEEIYLFEPRFGLPVPNADEPEVATLRQARADRNILRRCKLPGRFDYPIGAEDLANAVALLDIEPPALGVAMQLLEDRLTGDRRMKISVDADSIAKEINRIDPKLTVELWSMPWLAQFYNRLTRQQVKDKTPVGIGYQVVNAAYVYETLFNDARLTHFRGDFETTLDVNGAPNKYMASRIDDATLEKLAYDEDVQRQLQVLRQPNEPQEEYVARMNQFRQSFRAAKVDSNFFLGALQFDLENWDASIDWLDERLLRLAGSERWHPQAFYLLARCYEQKRDIGAALERLRTEKVPQEAGNRIRVRLLERMEADRNSLP